MKNQFAAILMLAAFCRATMVDLSCHEKFVHYNRNFCDMALDADLIYLGRITNLDSLSSTRNHLVAKEEFPFNDSIYSLFLKEYEYNETLKLQLKIAIEKKFFNKKWKKATGTKMAKAAEIRGGIWNGVDDILNYFHPMDWNDSLRVFFLKRTAQGDSLIGISKPFENADSVSAMCDGKSAYRKMSDESLSHGGYKNETHLPFCDSTASLNSYNIPEEVLLKFPVDWFEKNDFSFMEESCLLPSMKRNKKALMWKQICIL